MNESERWVTLSALGAAMFAVGFSCAGAACSARESSVDATQDRAQASAAPLAQANQPPSAARSAASTAPTSNLAPAARSIDVHTETPAVAHDGLKINRVVVTRTIVQREPSTGDEFSLGSAPIYAFVELENSATEPRSIRVVFQNQDTQASVGHVKLTVPPGQLRYRTWGNTRLIQDPGHWVAVISTSDGTELGRAAFEVKG